MTVTSLTLMLGLALVLLAVALNHVYARLALIELALNEGLPPGHEPIAKAAGTTTPIDVHASLGPGIHVFLSRTCHACQRLIEELDETALSLEGALHLRYVDRSRPIAASAAARHQASLHDHELGLASDLVVDPLPYTIAIGDHELVSRLVTPTLDQVLAAARDAGIKAQRV